MRRLGLYMSTRTVRAFIENTGRLELAKVARMSRNRIHIRSSSDASKVNSLRRAPASFPPCLSNAKLVRPLRVLQRNCRELHHPIAIVLLAFSHISQDPIGLIYLGKFF